MHFICSYPIHAAVLGRNFKLVKWLIEIECCPIHITPTSNTRYLNQHLLVTSNGRSVIDIAMDNHDIDILRYLVVERSAAVFGYRNMHTALRTLDMVIRRLPRSTDQSNNNTLMNIPESSVAKHHPVNPTAPPINDTSINHYQNSTSTYYAYDNGDEASLGDDAVSQIILNFYESFLNESANISTSNIVIAFQCIICYDERIDCVLTPCGHQICCIKCSSSLSNCPVCNTSCSYIRTYRP